MFNGYFITTKLYTFRQMAIAVLTHLLILRKI